MVLSLELLDLEERPSFLLSHQAMSALLISPLLSVRLSDLFLGEAAQHAQPRHGELAPRISSDLRGEDGGFCRCHLCTPVMQYQTCYKLGL